MTVTIYRSGKPVRISVAGQQDHARANAGEGRPLRPRFSPALRLISILDPQPAPTCQVPDKPEGPSVEEELKRLGIPFVSAFTVSSAC
jgi:hypothetical protein